MEPTKPCSLALQVMTFYDPYLLAKAEVRKLSYYSGAMPRTYPMRNKNFLTRLGDLRIDKEPEESTGEPTKPLRHRRLN